ncbi:phage tail protein [Chengkuizengella marina]|uniref:Uncharacterized protein n=1 Tax=Chengkuizengella marina TaxID=2507566 RepID=A0A6N9Q248_9BACL|nr:phage tail protein [Chengkuizengella marina]NBI28580.1 hypothetical protein [Chengkuizengella marina]
MLAVDFNNEPEKVQLYLCKPDRTTIAVLHEARDRRITFNYGGVSQLSFTLPTKIMQDFEPIDNPHIPLIRGDYLIRYEKGHEKIYFIITNPEVNTSDGEEEKTVECMELQYEWKNKLIRNYTGTKKLYDSSIDDDGVLNDTLLAKTDWKVKYIDPSIELKYRTFDETQTDLLEFFYNNYDRYGDIIPIIDTINKEVSFYFSENLGVNEGLTIEQGNYLKSLSENENFDDVVTRLYIYGKDNISINSKNPTGVDYIEDFSFYMYGFERDEEGNVISHSPYMSDELCIAIEEYNELLESKDGQFTILLDQKSTLQSEQTTLKNELFELETELKIIEDNIDTAVAVGDDLSDLNEQKAEKENQVVDKEDEIIAKQAEIENVEIQISELQSEVAVENNFAEELIIERNRFIKEQVWQDSNYSSADDLYEEGVERLKRLSQPIISYEIDSIDFLNALNTPHDWNRLKLGGIITVRYSNLGIDLKAKVIKIEHEIDGNKLKLTIANHKDIKNGFLKFADLLQRAVSTSTTVDMSKFKWDLAEETNTEMRQLLEQEWDANKRAILSGKDLNYSLDERGLTLKSPADDLNYLRAVHNVLAITNDGGNTFKNAITSQGVIAERLWGQIIAGENLTIQNEAGTFTFDKDGATLDGATLTIIGGLSEGNLDSGFVESINTLQTEISKFSDDGFIQFAESENLKINLNQVKSESVDFIDAANKLEITTEKTNYENALTTLESEIKNWIDQINYPMVVTEENRININSKFDDVQNKKSKLINKIMSVREQAAKDYTDANGFPFDNWEYSDTTLIDGGQIKSGTIEAESILAGILVGFTIKSKKNDQPNRVEIAEDKIEIIGEEEYTRIAIEADPHSINFYNQDSNGNEKKVLSMYSSYSSETGYESASVMSYGNYSISTYKNEDTIAPGSLRLHSSGRLSLFSEEPASITGVGSVSISSGVGGDLFLTGDTTLIGDFLAIGGTKNAGVLTSLGYVGVSAYETAEYYFGDIGKGEVSSGECRIDIDNLFKETVNTEVEYHVFLTAYGSGTIYLSERHTDYFIVRGDDIQFAYEIKAKRKDFEDYRLEVYDI